MFGGDMDLDVELINRVKGFLDAEEGCLLYETARLASLQGPCLEIGSYGGKSTLYLGTACRENNAILYSIDHHRGSEEQQPGEEYFDPELFDPQTFRVDTFQYFRNTIAAAGLEDTVVPIVSRSEIAARAWSTPLSLVFIDGGHSYETVAADYSAWSKYIAAGGYLLFHDIFLDTQAGGQAPHMVYRQALDSGLFVELPMVKTLGVLRRKKS